MSEQCMRPLPLPGGTAFCIREKGHFGPHRFPLLDGSAFCNREKGHFGALDTPTDTTSGGEREALRAENERLRKALEEIDQMAPIMEPEYDDWGGDTEAAENYGHESGLWDAGQIARAALDARKEG